MGGTAQNERLSFLKDLCLCVHVFYSHVCLCSVCVQCPWSPEEGVGTAPGSLVSHHVVAGNRI